ncbi:MAG TPA: AbrB/MazE/SpoVT family DNA-binding domain-containing protein [Thermoanaerobaculia bacterium]|nr:AbrB/MazE/SpoVT family DNA-binding domain-containing protein [Thermoanaerobaculia bacterium]
MECGGKAAAFEGGSFAAALHTHTLRPFGRPCITESRRKLGIGPGSVLEWDQEDDKVVVRKAGRYTSEEIHRALFTKRPKPRTIDALKQGVAKHVRKKHARR